METVEILRQKIYKEICKDGFIPSEDFSSDLIINDGKYEFFGIKAECMIYHSADAINLPIDYLAKNFSYEEYFEDEGDALFIPFVPFLIIFCAVSEFYRFFRNIILLLFKRPIVKYKKYVKPPLTAQQFADIMIGFLEKYQQDNIK
ncbi:hypothetical protein [Commensalibacter oyaizuii]|uniref:Uncharacterized protein n=1 Tax=Commensalibacter oyaizuii TaxID=3043873 RepID=A0ABT6Q4D1_9PROT|nr:hypothetical protein [Commensalibacter sp. TBRC 16381]MDI2091885.1 hypothetical protein [Commensalibacter sp. TBRC 16381]